MTHVPVLQKEVLKYLDPKPNENFIDCTIGEAGHALAILEKTAPKGKVLGIDWNPEIIKSLKSKARKAPWASGLYGVQSLRLKGRLILVCDNFVNLKEIVKNQNFRSVSGILLDLGISSWHLEESKKGFSFLRNEKLDMRYSPLNPLTAEKILNFWSLFQIERILKEYSQEPFSRQIAKEIVNSRKEKSIRTTLQLVEIIKRTVPKRYQRKRLHFATRTFQALRIAVNDELNNLEKTLPQALEILKINGSLVVISFHSLEDRIVKNFFRDWAKEGSLRILTKKPVRPSEKEIKLNPRSRSAKLRAAERIANC